MSVRPLRRLLEGGGFQQCLEALTEPERSAALEVARELRKEAELPGPDDVDEILPPCMPVGWRRAVSGTHLWVFYKLKGEDVVLRHIGVPAMLSDEAQDALEDERGAPPPTPYIRSVPSPPDDPDEPNEPPP